MQWTERMGEFDLVERRLTAELGKRPTLRRVAEALGVSHQTVRHHRWKREQYFIRQRRWGRYYDDHVQFWRHWVFANSANVLPLLIAAAEAAASRRKAGLWFGPAEEPKKLKIPKAKKKLNPPPMRMRGEEPASGSLYRWVPKWTED